MLKKNFYMLIIFFSIRAANQTDTITPVIKNASQPFEVTIGTTNILIPDGIHSGAVGIHKNKWLFICGRINGLHGFANDNNNFPPQTQNTNVYVINIKKGTVKFRSLKDRLSGLNQAQIDYLSVTSPQYSQTKKTLYITGGYGIDTKTGIPGTKDILTAIDIKGLIKWVSNPKPNNYASQYIRQIQDPIFQVTGGVMGQIKNNPMLLMFGQNFAGFYQDGSNGEYTNQVRRFCIIDNGKSLSIKFLQPTKPDPNYRRRDLNIVPIVELNGRTLEYSFLALSGVFTTSDGAWTVPVNISESGNTSMANPNSNNTFKQAMNNYASAHCQLFSQKTNEMFILLFGGITFGNFQGNNFVTSSELPFTSQASLIRLYNGNFSQYFLGEYPIIHSTRTHPGNRLLFGAGAHFIPSRKIAQFENNILNLDKITKPQVIGYIVGGIQSTVPNTNSMDESAASPYIFSVSLSPNKI